MDPEIKRLRAESERLPDGRYRCRLAVPSTPPAPPTGQPEEVPDAPAPPAI